jgi:hypothetical protein
VRAAFALLPVRSAPGLIFALALCIGCTRPAEGPLPGASEAWKNPAEAEPSRPAPARPTWDQYANVRQWPAENAAPFVSRGHELPEAVDVRVSPESRPIYQALVADSVFPDGSVLAELAHGAAGPGYGMHKVGGSWRFFELSADGGVISSGALALCTGCHAQSPADGVFGLPRDSADGR